MIQQELSLIVSLTGVAEDRIVLEDDGFFSRGYVAEGGRLVFKFPKREGVDYRREAALLNRLNSLSPGVALQRVGWADPENRYLGLYGVPGRPLERICLTPALRQTIGRQLARFLLRLHRAPAEDLPALSLEQELSAWQTRYQAGQPVLARFFTPAQRAKIDRFFLQDGPETLLRLGERLVFSHGDLGDGNILIQPEGQVGVIDFSESCRLDEAADFMDLRDEALCRILLDCYGADDVLRQKTAIRRAMRPFFVLETYAPRGDGALAPFLGQIRRWLEGSSL